MDDGTQNLRGLPSVDAVLRWPQVKALALPRALKTRVVRSELSRLRKKSSPIAVDSLQEEILQALMVAERWRLRPLINLTGVLLHTNLGRAPLASAAVARVAAVAAAYSNLELDLESGERGGRLHYVRELLAALMGDLNAVVVNNNAAAVLLAVRGLARGREVVISRGELMEIGGSFRIPEILEAAGAHLREVGTTNRTHLGDYENAIHENTALLLKIHPSNFRQLGYCACVSTSELVALGKRRGLPVMEDLGSGNFMDLRQVGAHGLPHEPQVADVWKTGVTCLTFSGDKLLGGPQCGVIVGTDELIGKLRHDPLYRTYRLSKLDLAALEATLEILLDRQSLTQLPVLRSLAAGEENLKPVAQRLTEALLEQGWMAKLSREFSEVGGGALPATGLATWVVRVAHPQPEALAQALRRRPLPVVARIDRDELVCDVRTLLPDQESQVLEAFVEMKNVLVEKTATQIVREGRNR